ncbi:SulP family inorganic anion transporter [Streptomyces huiliensis]|uniref:SulP family inorganic anion transporter n=1 Tax=Streptomyces huiliensis TaxID=2876027 RepID=UPI001CBD2B7C|nr:SulP family inorganic anion transporter [Streptomyces huiliensis]MBZ4324445.1 SulP family inorganic anion transporter [Streptomyces huiliensis]
MERKDLNPARFVTSRPGTSRSDTGRLLRADVHASLVVFLITVPLSAGVAVASGVPVELGLVTGIVGGLLTGLLPGSSIQVSGPAAGLAALVYEAVRVHGLGGLGVLVLATGLLQVVLGLLRLGRWFRKVPVAVVQGMLAGTGLVLITGQLYELADADAPGGGLERLGGLVLLVTGALEDPAALAAGAVGVGTMALMALWQRWPRGVRLMPAPLAAVLAATAATALLRLPVDRLRVGDLMTAVQPPDGPDFVRLGQVGVLGTVLAFTLVASAGSMFGAAAVDRLHDGPRTDYDKELIAQGAGNTVCGMLGALPMTTVVVRSTANAQAGARTRASRVLQGLWLAAFAALLPWALGAVPVAALAGVLVVVGRQLLPGRELGRLWDGHRGEVVALLATAAAIVVTDPFEGAVIGLLLAGVKAGWETTRLRTDRGRGRRGEGRAGDGGRMPLISKK